MTRRFLSSAVLLSVALVATACGSSTEAASETSPSSTTTLTEDTALHDLLPESVRSSGTLTLGALWETPPMIGVDASDTTTPVGVAPDLAQALGQVLGVDVEWQNMQWPAQLPGVQSGAVDALMGQVSVTAEREQSVVDLVPFYRTTESLLLPADNPDGIASLKDMCGMTVGVPVGSIQGEEVSAVSDAHCAGDAIQLAEYQGATAAVSAVRAGTVDAWLDTTTTQLQAVEASSGAFTTAELPEDESPANYTAIAVGKANPGLSNALVGALKAVIEDGAYDDVLEAHDVSSAALTADDVVANPITGTAVGATA
ncbi:transporter substrate-binding domain-containing protein [Kineococcus sp. SYSU DK003]|uniref:transporter substrate-binding domain-containing protein n=1 Tax=Kineococcus sp. SYSU DK003 TaxID=3383124 RepID=UPI003D7D9054